jgi:hypothetical protein
LREKLARFVASGVGLPPPGEARGGAKFPRQGALSTSAVERPPEVKLGRYCCSRRVLEEQEFAFDTKQFGEIPVFLAVARLRKRFVYD